MIVIRHKFQVIVLDESKSNKTDVEFFFRFIGNPSCIIS